MGSTNFAESVRYAFDMAHSNTGWISPFKGILKGVGREMAAWKPAAEVRSIWEVVAHSHQYTNRLLCLLTGAPMAKAEDWPSINDTSQSAWKEMKKAHVRVISSLEQTIGSASDDFLAGVPEGFERPRYPRILDLAIHDAYHAGQVVKLKQLYRASFRP